jgi:head-tail adaptor
MDARVRVQLGSIERMIHSGKWKEARWKLELLACDSVASKYAQTWFMLGLVQSLVGKSELADTARDKAKLCSDYDAVYEGDFLRDKAFVFIKQDKHDQATDCLALARQLHADDPNRMAYVIVAEGCMLARQGRIEMAYHRHVTAESRFRRLGKAANKQWRTGNRLHLMIAAVLSGHRVTAWARLPRLLLTDLPARKVAGLTVCFGGRQSALRALEQY